jgi:hypothetical protein
MQKENLATYLGKYPEIRTSEPITPLRNCTCFQESETQTWPQNLPLLSEAP